MANAALLATLLRDLDLLPEVRSDPEQLPALLRPDFCESVRAAEHTRESKC